MQVFWILGGYYRPQKIYIFTMAKRKTRRFSDVAWNRATVEAFNRLPETCPPLKEAFSKSYELIAEYCKLNAIQRRRVSSILSSLRKTVRTQGTEALRRELVVALAERYRPPRKGAKYAKRTLSRTD